MAYPQHNLLKTRKLEWSTFRSFLNAFLLVLSAINMFEIQDISIIDSQISRTNSLSRYICLCFGEMTTY